MEMETKLYINNPIDNLKFTNSEDKLEIEGYCCHWNKKNLNGEIVMKESFDTFFAAYSKGTIRPVLNHEHDNSRVIGGIDELDRDDTGLYIIAHLNKTIPYVNEWLVPNIVAGDIKNLSTEGFPVGGINSIKINEDKSYTVLDFMLTAVAIVNHPADTIADFSVRNYMQGVPNEDEVKEEINKSKWFLFS